MTLKEYYKYYLSLHQSPMCRRMHFIGQLATLVYIFVAINESLVLLLLAPFIIYPFAWYGHFKYENNTPAAFTDPIKAKICDWIMFLDIVKGKLSI